MRDAAPRPVHAKVVGVLVPDLVNPFFAGLVGAIEAAVHRDGYDLLVATTSDDPTREPGRLEALLAWRPAGLIVAPTTGTFTSRDMALDAGLPMVLVDRLVEEPSFDMVGIDNAAAAELAMAHLLDHGHHAVLVVASSLGLANIAERCRGVQRAAAAAGRADAVEILETGRTLDEARSALDRRLAEGRAPTAVLGLNLIMALAAMGALAAAGLAVPADVSLVSFDDYVWMGLASPSITAVRQPVEQIGAAAWERLLGRIGGESRPFSTLRLDCSLQIRASTTQVRRRLSPRARETATLKQWSRGGRGAGLARRDPLDAS